MNKTKFWFRVCLIMAVGKMIVGADTEPTIWPCTAIILMCLDNEIKPR